MSGEGTQIAFVRFVRTLIIASGPTAILGLICVVAWGLSVSPWLATAVGAYAVKASSWAFK